jgi:exonuclease I
MKLFSYYSLDECVDRKKVLAKLKSLVKEGKIEYDLDKTTDVFHIEDLDLDEEDIEELLDIFDENEVFPYLEFEDDEDDEDDIYGGYDEDEDEY